MASANEEMEAAYWKSQQRIQECEHIMRTTDDPAVKAEAKRVRDNEVRIWD